MTTKRIVDNSERPAQPEPSEDPATQTPRIREEGRNIDRQHRGRNDEEVPLRGKASE